LQQPSSFGRLEYGFHFKIDYVLIGLHGEIEISRQPRSTAHDTYLFYKIRIEMG
jgi:hypothetical protein